jgi:hypothetical protein
VRVGAAQQLTVNGVQLLPNMRAGGRSMNVVALYVENVDIKASGRRNKSVTFRSGWLKVDPF